MSFDDRTEDEDQIDAGRRKLGGLDASELGLGVQNMHRTVHTLVPDRDAMIALIQSAYDHGVTFFDCTEVYGPFTCELTCEFTCERILGEAMTPFRDQVQVTTKFGFTIDPETGVWDFTVNSKSESIRRAGGRRISCRYARNSASGSSPFRRLDTGS